MTKKQKLTARWTLGILILLGLSFPTFGAIVSFWLLAGIAATLILVWNEENSAANSLKIQAIFVAFVTIGPIVLTIFSFADESRTPTKV